MVKNLVLSVVGIFCVVTFVQAREVPETRDLLSNAQTSITLEHSMIHQGKTFNVSASTASLADATTAVMLIDLTSMTSAYLHLTFEPVVSGQSYIEIYEGCSFASSGTAITAYNYERFTSTIAAGAIQPWAVWKFYPSPINVTTDGTLIKRVLMSGGASPVFRSGAVNNHDSEYILDGGRAYSLVLRNSSGGAEVVSMDINFYYRLK